MRWITSVARPHSRIDSAASEYRCSWNDALPERILQCTLESRYGSLGTVVCVCRSATVRSANGGSRRDDGTRFSRLPATRKIRLGSSFQEPPGPAGREFLVLAGIYTLGRRERVGRERPYPPCSAARPVMQGHLVEEPAEDRDEDSDPDQRIERLRGVGKVLQVAVGVAVERGRPHDVDDESDH